MLQKINGLPAHILLVHAVVVLVPLAALLAVVAAWWPAARQRLGVLTPLLALAGLAFVPLTTNAGEWLQEHIQETPQIDRHAEMGDGLLPWAGLLFLLAAALWLLDYSAQREWHVPPVVRAGWVRPVVGVLIVAVAVVAVYEVYRIGDSGAKAAWDGKLTSGGGGG
jgi:hypothetical protein